MHMAYGEGYELFTCPQCGSSLLFPNSGCQSCGYARPLGPTTGTIDQKSTYSGGDAVLKARLDRAELDCARHRAATAYQALPTQEELLRRITGTTGPTRRRKKGGRGPGKAKRGNSRPDSLSGRHALEATPIKKTHVALSSKPPKQTKPAADHGGAESTRNLGLRTTLRSFPPVKKRNYNSWLNACLVQFGALEPSLDESTGMTEADAVQGRLALLLYQLFSELKQQDNRGHEERCLHILQSILDLTGPLDATS